MRTPAPSAGTNPSRSASNDREAALGSPRLVDNAPIWLNPEIIEGTRHASVPPVIAAALRHTGKIDVFEWREDMVEPLQQGVRKAALEGRVTVIPFDLTAPELPEQHYDGLVSFDDLGEAETLVVYEAPTRVVAALADMAEIWGDRDAFLCREATKVHEEYVRGSLAALRDRLAARPEVKGEVVLVVEGAAEETQPDANAETVYAALAAQGLTRREAVKETARRLGLPAREVYKRVLEESD